MKKNVKYAMIGVMLLGLFTAACSIGKAVTSEFINSDPPWQDVDVTIWTATEHQMGIFVACLPSLRPVLDTVTGTSWKNLLSWTYSKRSISDSKQNEHEEFYTQRQQFEQLGSDVSDMLPLKHYKQVRDSTDAE
ncbi:hypothetical protein MMC11_008670 [Xylographa trunciseda]|nr:hypothetical protein [Xylographa trunciseda]